MEDKDVLNRIWSELRDIHHKVEVIGKMTAVHDERLKQLEARLAKWENNIKWGVGIIVTIAIATIGFLNA